MIDKPAKPPGERIWQHAAALWGFAEAILFFVVPDVLLSFAVLRFGWRRAIASAVAATFGALVGGALMFAWGSQDASGAEAALDLVPAIAPGIISATREAMTGAWPSKLFVGAVSGVPYKIYAVEAGAAGINLIAFLGVSAAARFARFAGTIIITELGRRILAGMGQARWAHAVLSGFWLCLYAAYFWFMPN
jgi:membrane protein YqaA with SNARE-associated domain